MSTGDKRSTIPTPEATSGDYHHRGSRCLLPETYPDIHFNEDGVCNFCIEYEQKNTVADSSKRKKRKEWMEKFILDAKRRNKSKYDILVSYSDGKDSTYLLKEQFGLRVLAYSCDTGFMSEEAHRNVNRTIAKLGVDHIWRRPGEDFYRKLYSYLLTHPKEEGCVAPCARSVSGQLTSRPPR